LLQYRLTNKNSTIKSYFTIEHGTLIEISEGKSYQGKWSYEHKTMSITTDDRDGIEKQKILKITADQLILKSKYNEMPMNLIWKRID
jgi:hypothetical protein